MDALTARLRQHLSIVFVYAITLALWIGTSIAVHGFAATSNIRSVLVQASILAVPAAGQTFVILGGGIDLSVPWMMTVSGMLTAVRSENHGTASTLVFVFAVAIVVGLVNGLGVTALRVPPIVMTLATNVVLSGAIVIYVGPAPPSGAPTVANSLVYGSVLGVPGYLLLLLGTAVVATGLAGATRFGRELYAVGTSVQVSRFSGIRPAVIQTGSYIVSSCAAAVGGIALLGYVGTAFLGMGDPYQFASIAAVVVGGASILGGSGNYLGTLGGALLLTVLLTILHLFSLGQGVVDLFYGGTILVAVWIASPQMRRMLRWTSQPSALELLRRGAGPKG